MDPEPCLRPAQITGVILAGGRARRLGGVDKGLVEVAGLSLVERVIGVLTPQVGSLLINANRESGRYLRLGHPVIPDQRPGFPGPLAGIASALAAAPTDWILCVPCDTPWIPPDLGNRLGLALEAGRADLAVAHDGVRLQPLHALIPVRLARSLDAYLDAGGSAVQDWYHTLRSAVADFSDQPGGFANLNTWGDLREMERRLGG
ncbi:MAG: molybdenum cofactor guanylyltransferase MobA [Bdellovibrio bacteriovorus]